MSNILNTVNKLLTPYNHTNGDVSRIKYIVIHYVGALGGAKANCQWYAGGNRSASAHYYVDFDGSIWQSVEDKNIAWHCGAKKYVHPECRNANSIGIELCVRNHGSLADTSRDWYFEDKTVMAAIELTKALMEKYHIAPDHVIRHYDVTGKICPNPFVYNSGKYTWEYFKKAISSPTVKKSGWVKEDTGWKFYLGDTGECVKNDWYNDGTGWCFFDGAGIAVHDNWYQYKNHWYYFGADCYALKSSWLSYKGNDYYFDSDNIMATSCYVKSKDPNSKKYYWLNADGIYEPQWDTESPDLTKYRLAI